MTTTIRRVDAGEWPRVRQLRLRALADPIAHLAFLDTLENASAQPESFWQERTRNAASGDGAAQFVAISAEGEWFASATVLPHSERAAAGLVVGVYVAEGHRGAGTLEALFDAVADWAAETGLTDLLLEVHVDNHRALRAYERSGFTRTGEIVQLDNGAEYVMIRPLKAAGTVDE